MNSLLPGSPFRQRNVPVLNSRAPFERSAPWMTALDTEGAGFESQVFAATPFARSNALCVRTNSRMDAIVENAPVRIC